MLQTDKASLLAEVIQHVKELKRQTSEITEEEACPLPTESDELTVDAGSDEDGRLVVRASLCCDDRADLLPDLVRALKALRLRALKAEITTLGGRVKNVLLITADDDSSAHDGQREEEEEEAPMSPQRTVASIQEALRAVMERTASAAEESGAAAASTGGAAGLKRQRMTSLSAILENRSI
jgi:UTP:GlnB (protein PII) uridylyltransferase